MFITEWFNIIAYYFTVLIIQYCCCHYPFLFCPNKLALSQPTCFTSFPVLFPFLLGRNEQMVVCFLAASQVKTTTQSMLM